MRKKRKKKEKYSFLGIKYFAPETSKFRCNKKSDIYRLRVGVFHRIHWVFWTSDVSVLFIHLHQQSKKVVVKPGCGNKQES